MLPKIISEYQAGFVSGRHIEDNILLALELMMGIGKKLKEPNLILKLIMEKAYDRLDWAFLMSMLCGIGFGEWFANLVYRALSNNWFSILINGEQMGFSNPFMGYVKEILCLLPFLLLWQNF